MNSRTGPEIKPGRDSLPARHQRDDLSAWREQTLTLLLRAVFVLATVVGVPSALYGLYTGMPQIFWVDLAALAALGAVTFAPGLAFRLRASGFLLIVLVFGAWMLSEILVVGMAYLLALPILGALLLGLWPGVLLLLIKALTMLTVGFLAVADGPFLDMEAITFTAWFVITANYTFIGAILTLGSALLLRRLDAALLRQQASNEELAQEVARRRRAQTERARLAQVVQQSPLLIIIAAADGGIDYRNAAAEALFGPAGTETPQSLADLAAAQAPETGFGTALAACAAWEGELTWAAADDTEYRLAASMLPLPDEDGTAASAVIILRDVTDERLMERRLRQAERLEATGTFAGGIAHDFNNIIGAILALAEEGREVCDDPHVREGIAGIEVACGRAQAIVRQMLLIGRGNDAVERRSEHLGNLLREAMPLLRAALPAAIDIELDVASEAAVRIHPADLNQILLNLASNAAHAMAGQAAGRFGITLEEVGAGADVLQAHPRLDEDRGYLCLRVRDTGCGIPAEHRERIFDAFFTTKGVGEGTGLGLASVHGIVVSLGGDLSVYSELGRGTTFRIYLPAADAEAPVQHEPSAEAEPADAARSGRILLVDDEETILTLTARFLERAGHTVTRAADGSSARELFAADPGAFDLLITDLTMPGCSGEELIEFVHGLRADVPAILTSGFGGHRRMVDELESRKLVSYLDKPFRRSELLDCVREALAVGEINQDRARAR